jgi:predicted alpha/beta hydrolase family esterase
MTERVFIIHGWEGYPEEGWFPWLKKELENNVAIFSDNDPYVPLRDSEIFKEKLGAKIIVERGKGHFSGEDNITKLPVVLDEIVKMAD